MIPLTRFGFVDELSPEGKSTLAAGIAVHRAPPGRSLIRRGDRVAGIYFVEEGTIRVYQQGPTGRQQTLYWVGPGESCILAVNCVFSHVTYPAYVETDDEETRFAILDAASYRALYESEPAVQRYTFEVLSRRVVELTESLAEAGTLDVEQRVVSLLLRRCEDGVVRMNQERIARHVGTAREVVSRVLRGLAKEGLVKGRRGAVELLDLDGLSARIE